MTAQADDELWSAIADPSRRRVLDLVVSNGEVSASWLAGRVPFSRQAVSKHLVVLEQAGLSAGANRAGRCSTRWRPTVLTRPPRPWLTWPRNGTGGSP